MYIPTPDFPLPFSFPLGFWSVCLQTPFSIHLSFKIHGSCSLLHAVLPSSCMAHLLELGVRHLVSFASVSPTSCRTPHRTLTEALRKGMGWVERSTGVPTYIWYFLTHYSLCSCCPSPHLLITTAIGINDPSCPLLALFHWVRPCSLCQQLMLAPSLLGSGPQLPKLHLTSMARPIPRLFFIKSGHVIPTRFLQRIGEVVPSEKKSRGFFLLILSLHMNYFSTL